MNSEDERYFARIEDRLEEALDRAGTARAQGRDPEPEVEIPIATDMADRVEKVLGIPGVAERVRDLEGECSREEAALELVTDFVEGTVGDFDSRAAKIEGAVRTAVALLTEGVVAAPIEGIDRVEILENDDGSEFVNVYYAGPIRSAGGTAQALSVLVADYARSLLDIDRYKPRREEVERYAEEVALYDDETGLQYSPTDAETTFIAEHLPVMLDGEATGDAEVSGFRDLERVDTNNPRGGMCLVLAEGIALKAAKIQRYTDSLDAVDWPWLADFRSGEYGDAAEDTPSEGNSEEEAGTAEDGTGTGDDDGETAVDAEGTDAAADAEGTDHRTTVTEPDADPTDDGGEDGDAPPRADPSKKYLRDLIAGRPVFGHPSEPGGFRLRYGRARNHGFATAGVHPATMHLVDDFLATGTQIKTERPGKAAGVVPVDTIEGPTVRLANGDVRRIDDPEEALEVRNGVEEILDLGEYLVNYGEFVENNHRLVPASYTVEWWVQEFAAAGADVQALRDSPHVDLSDPTAAEALEWATEYDCSLHPAYTYLWHDVSVEAFERLAEAVADGRVVRTDGEGPSTGGEGHHAADGGRTAGSPDPGGDAGNDVGAGTVLVLDRSEPVRRTLERLLVEHGQSEDALRIPDYRPLVASLGVEPAPGGGFEQTWTSLSAAAREFDDGDNAVRAVREVAPFDIRERAPTRVGNRMGRPEKSESRELSPTVHTLFPIGDAGGSQRSVGEAAGAYAGNGERGLLDVEVGERACPDCGTHTYRPCCPDCGAHTDPHYECSDCGVVVDPDEAGRIECPRCGRTVTNARRRSVDLHAAYRKALDQVGEREAAFDILKGVKGLSSAGKTPEPLAKGILRAKHGVSTFKDGTVRYDMTDLPVTAVRPAELDVTAEHFRELGYGTDVDGDPLRHDDQLVELKVQDIVLSEGAAAHLRRTADFVDELLTEFYGLEPFYRLEERDDLVGELVFGMAPHTSAAVVGRVVGFTDASVGYAHPYFHAAKRRNCFHPGTKVWYREANRGWQYGRIDKFVEERLDPESAETDDLGTVVSEVDGEVAVPALDEDGQRVVKPVETVSKHVAQEHLVRIETRSGRELTVTPDHEVHVFDGQNVVSRRASELTESDHVVTPEGPSVPDAETNVPTFDLLAEFIEVDAIDRDELMIKGLETDRLYRLFEDRLAEGWDGEFYPLESTATHLGLTKQRLSNYLYRERIPVSLLLEFFDSTGDLLAFVPEDVALGMKRDRTEIDRHLRVNERVATLLGYYAAEGFARAQSTTKGTIHQTTICGTEREAREFYLETFRTEFGVDPYRENDAKVTVSGRLLRTVFDTVLDAGVSAAEKRVPRCLFGAPDRIVEAYLRGYFSGDGSAHSDSLVVDATTVSRELKEDLFALLKRLGITASASIEDPVPLASKFPEDYDDDGPMSERRYVVEIRSGDAVRYADRVGFHLSRKQRTLEETVDTITPRPRRAFDGGAGEYLVEEVATVEYVTSDTSHTYCLTVSDTHSLIANDLSVKQCDGDEDCVMLLMDGLLNFSKSFLPDQRGGQMDAPLVMSSRVDPAEIDDEAHNMDVVERYPLAFYEATRRMADPETVDVELAGERVGTDGEYRGFAFTHDTADIAQGPALSAYKTLGDMETKMDAQLELARKLRAVDETDVAERVIEYHFLPDLIGNLRAFSRQETRCLDCGEKFRRMPLTGDCRECGGDVTLTVHEGSVSKYLETATRIAEEFGCREYTKQRLEILERRIESIFENDRNKPTSLGDFM